MSERDAVGFLQHWLVDLDTGRLFYATLLIQHTQGDGTTTAKISGVTLDGQRHSAERLAILDQLSEIILNAVFNKKATDT